MENTKDLNYYKNNCEEDYINTPISVLRYITELEQALQLQQTGVSGSDLHDKIIKQIPDAYKEQITKTIKSITANVLQLVEVA